jgi:hypothetical protein
VGVGGWGGGGILTPLPMGGRQSVVSPNLRGEAIGCLSQFERCRLCRKCSQVPFGRTCLATFQAGCVGGGVGTGVWGVWGRERGVRGGVFETGGMLIRYIRRAQYTDEKLH